MNRKTTNYNLRRLNGRHLTAVLFFIFSFNLAFSNIWQPWCPHRRGTQVAAHGCGDRFAIEEIRIEQGQNLIYRKAPDGCAGPFNINAGTNSREFGGVMNSSSTPIVLSAGATYRIGMSSRSRVGTHNGFAGLWIDYNQNRSFGTDELVNLAQNSWPVNSPQGNIGNVSFMTFTIPCDINEGLTRLRVTLDASTLAIQPDKGCMIVANTPSNYPFFGETEDFYIRIEKSTTLAADFIVPNNVWVNSPVTFVNFNRGGFIAHEWDRGLNGYDFTGVDFTTIFNTPGTQTLKLRSTNCAGSDSVIKSVNVLTPTSVPNVDFVASANNIEVGNELTLFDLSTNGPTAWNWQLNNPVDPTTDKSNAEGIGVGFQNGFNRVRFSMNDVGVFNTCLTAINGIGNGSRCKTSFINVTPISEIRLGIGDNITQLAQGTIFDRGGRNGNYSTGTLGNPQLNSLLIQPCGATEIELNISQFRFADNSHNLRVWDGSDAGGKPLHPQGGFNRTNTDVPFRIVATSGVMYLELNTTAGTATDSGLIAHFNAILGQVSKPIPSFAFAVDGQTRGFTNAITSIRSNSGNLFGVPTYGWSVNGVPVPPSNTSENGRMLNFQFPSQGNYNVCLNVISCAGDSSLCQTVNVINPVGQTRLEFNVDNRRPAIDEVVTFSTISDKASNFRWEIAPLNYTLAPGSTLNSQNLRVSFTQPGPYRIQLRGWNTFDSSGTTRMTVRDSFIQVVNYCDISSNALSRDVGNNLLQLSNVNNEVIYNQPSTSGLAGYQNFATGATDPIILQVGGTYHLTMQRNTNFDPISRVVYVDWNGDGIFTQDELVMDIRNKTTLTESSMFKVPDIDKVILGAVRMRAIVSYGNLAVNPCSNVAAGEIEDYRVLLFTSPETPVITLTGSPLVYVHLNSPYNDLGATAHDPFEGDITNRIITTSNVNINQVGLYSVRYNLINANNIPAAQVTRTVIVTADNIAPVITLNGANPDYLEAGTGSYKDPGYSAFDNVDGDITALVVLSGSVDHTRLGHYTLRYAVNDASGNSTTVHRNVEVGDKTPPVINSLGGTNIELGRIWSDNTFATDNYWTVGNGLVLNKTFGFNGPVNWNVRGLYDVHYHAIDGSGNQSQLTRTYRVDDFTPPTILLNTTDTVLHDVNTPYTSVNPTIFDNFTPANELSFFRTGSVNPFRLGTYVETFRVIDESGNQTEARRVVIVLDRVAPTIAAPYICTPLYNVFNNRHGLILEDNYNSPEELLPRVVATFSNVNIFFEGMYKAAYQVTDLSGNASIEVWRDIEVNNNCEKISSVSTLELEKNIKVFPNPSSGLFSIDLGKASSDIHFIEIFNAIGERVMTVSNQHYLSIVDVNMNAFASGVYTVKLSGEQISINKKMMIVK
jgi:hypothetical protein